MHNPELASKLKAQKGHKKWSKLMLFALPYLRNSYVCNRNKMQKINSKLETKVLHPTVISVQKEDICISINLAYLFMFEIFIHSFCRYLWDSSIMSEM